MCSVGLEDDRRKGGGEKPSLKEQFVWIKVKQIYLMGDLNSIGEKCMNLKTGSIK
jgi:hypothetical protein